MVQFVIRAQLRFVESVARLANFFGIEIPIPGRDLGPAVFLIANLLDVGGFALGVSDRRRREIAQKFVHGRNIVSGLVFELVSGPIRVTEQLRFLGSQLRCSQNNSPGIELAAFAVARKRRPHDLLTQLSILQRPEQRLSGRVLQLNHELAFLVLRLRGRSDARHLIVGQTGEIFFAIDDD